MDVIAIRDNEVNKVIARYQKYFADAISILLSTKKGLKAEAVFDFISVSKLSNNQVEQLLNKTIKTFNSYKANNTVLDATTSEKLLKLFALYEKGCLIFSSVEEFNQWLALPAIGLGGQIPFSLLDTITGIQMVNEELTRIEYGDLA